MEDLVTLPKKIPAKTSVFAKISNKVKNLFSFEGFAAPAFA